MQNFLEISRPNLQTIAQEMQSLVDLSLEKIKTLKQKEKTFISFLRPFQEIQEAIDLLLKPLAIVNATKNTKINQKAFMECIEILTNYSNKISQDKELFEIYKEILNTDKSLNTEQTKLLKDAIRDFELSGVLLDAKKREEISKINLELSVLSNLFSQNVLDDTAKAPEIILKTDEFLKAMPRSEKENFKTQDGYSFSLQSHSYIALMTYCSDSKTRQKAYKAYSTRGEKNGEIIEKIIKLKRRKSKLLGFKNYAEYSLQTKMANSPKEVNKFLKNLLKSCIAPAKQEFKALEKFAQKKLKVYDTAFYSKRLEEQSFSLNEEKYREYFEINSVLKGTFDLLGDLFNLEFTPVKTAVWDKSVRVYDISQIKNDEKNKKNEKIIARIYLDLEARANKRSGAWMDSIQNRYTKANGDVSLPSAYISCNFAPKKPRKPLLLKHDDIQTLFHELGHALQHLLTTANELFTSGINGIEWDAVEFPSQWLENFAYEKFALEKFAKHYKTKKPMPTRMINALVKTKNFQSALATIRQLEFGLFDINLYKKAKTQKDVQDILNATRKKTSLIKVPKYNKFQHSFSHIFGGGYSAGYYSYKWAQCLSADAFYICKDSGFDASVTKRFQDTVLSLGASLSAADVFEKFAQRKLDITALLRLEGIVND